MRISDPRTHGVTPAYADFGNRTRPGIHVTIPWAVAELSPWPGLLTPIEPHPPRKEINVDILRYPRAEAVQIAAGLTQVAHGLMLASRNV